MMMTVRPIRALVVSGAATGAAWWLGRTATDLAAAMTLDALVTAAVLAGGCVAAAVLALTTAAALAQGVTGRRPRAADSLPLPLKRFLVGTVAAAVAAGAAIPASADEAYPGWAPTVPTASPTATAGPVPEPTTAPPHAPSPTPGPASPSPAPSPPSPPSGPSEPPTIELHGESWAPALPDSGGSGAGAEGEEAAQGGAIHVVARGESLWTITRAALAAGASDAEIADAWPLVYEANRNVIGADPGLIHPGQQLTIPREVAA